MLATCPECGAEIRSVEAETILRCPKCRRYVPVGDMRFESRPRDEPDRHFIPKKGRSRVSLSPTARAFLLAIAVVAIMSWAVRLTRHKAQKTPDARLIRQNSQTSAVFEDPAAWAATHAAAIHDYAEDICRARGPSPLAGRELTSEAKTLAAFYFAEQSLQRILQHNPMLISGQLEIPCHAPEAPCEEAPFMQDIATRAWNIAALAAALAASSDTNASFASAVAEIGAALKHPPDSSSACLCIASGLTVESLCLSARIGGASAVELRYVLEKLRPVAETPSLKDCAQAVAAIATALHVLGAAPAWRQAGADVFATIRANREIQRIHALDDTSRLAVEAEAMALSFAAFEP